MIQQSLAELLELLDTPFDKIQPQGQMPKKIKDADWQPPFTENSGSIRVYLDGEPVSGAFAARHSRPNEEGWVMFCAPKTQIHHRSENSEYQLEAAMVTKKVKGLVTLRRTKY